MKIGAGGLQGIIAQEVARGLESSRLKPEVEKALLQSEDPNLRKLLHELNKAVERMRKAAETYNQPLVFVVKKGERPRIKAQDRRTKASREFTLEEAEAWLEGIERSVGRNLNGYA